MYDEQRVLRRIRDGDRCAFEELIDEFETRVYRLALRYADLVPDAEDLTQEIFLGIYRNIGGFRGRSALSTWIYRVALNHCLEYRRKKRPEQVPLDDGLHLASTTRRDDPVQAATMVELSEQVEKALGKLTPIPREVVILHEMHGLTYGECAETLGVPVGTVKSRLSNAFVRLRELLGGCLCEEC